MRQQSQYENESKFTPVSQTMECGISKSNEISAWLLKVRTHFYRHGSRSIRPLRIASPRKEINVAGQDVVLQLRDMDKVPMSELMDLFNDADRLLSDFSVGRLLPYQLNINLGKAIIDCLEKTGSKGGLREVLTNALNYMLEDRNFSGCLYTKDNYKHNLNRLKKRVAFIYQNKEIHDMQVAIYQQQYSRELPDKVAELQKKNLALKPMLDSLKQDKADLDRDISKCKNTLGRHREATTLLLLGKELSDEQMTDIRENFIETVSKYNECNKIMVVVESELSACEKEVDGIDEDIEYLRGRMIAYRRRAELVFNGGNGNGNGNGKKSLSLKSSMKNLLFSKVGATTLEIKQQPESCQGIELN